MKIHLFLFLLCSCFSGFSQSFDSIQKNRIPEKIKELDSLILIYNQPKLIAERGYLRHLSGEFDKAMIDYDKAIEIDSTLYLIFYNRAHLKEKLKDYNSSLIDYNRTIALDTNNFKAFYNRALVKTELNDIKGAISDYTKTISLDPKNSLAYHNRGNLKRKQKLFKESISDYDKAIEINPLFFVAIQNRAISKASTGNKDALNDFNKLILLDPNGEAYSNRALYYIHNQPEKDYCSDLKKAVDLNFLPAQKLLNQYCKSKK
jgi:tetratricopeptide (TPR) repeat protein